MGENIINSVKAGLPLRDICIIDCHCHLGFYKNFNIPANTAEDMLRSMDIIGVNYKACIAPHAASVGPDYRYGNNIAVETVTKYPKRFFGYVAINPSYDMLW